MSDKLVTIKNVKGFIDEAGVPQLSVEDIAKGFGFTQTKNNVRYVRWETINGYLNEFGFSQHVGKGSFIPENMVYRLGFKANNETAQKFQALLADEILPTIRKAGVYHIQSVSSLQALQMTVDELVKQDKRLTCVEATLDSAVDQIHINDAQAFQLYSLVTSRATYFSKITTKSYRAIIGQIWKYVNSTCSVTKYRSIRSVDFSKALKAAEGWNIE